MPEYGFCLDVRKFKKIELTFNKNLKFFLLSKTVHYTQINRVLSGGNKKHRMGWLAVTF